MMTSIRSWLTGVLAASVVLSGAAGAAESIPFGDAVVRLGPTAAPTVVQAPFGYSARRRTATITVTYTGFSASAKTAFQRAVDIWETQISSPVPIRVNAKWDDLGTGGILGSAGPERIFKCSASCPAGAVADTWYPVALFNKLAGSDVSPGVVDIHATFNKTFTSWNFKEAAAPGNKIDFTSVVLHELGHGLGFIGAGKVNGSTGTVRNSGFPMIFDRFTMNAAGKKLITFTDPSAQLKTQLTSNGVFFRRNATTKYKLFAPNPFQPGSSYSHLNENSFPNGNVNSLMTPTISFGETIRDPGPVTLTIFKLMGWN